MPITRHEFDPRLFQGHRSQRPRFYSRRHSRRFEPRLRGADGGSARRDRPPLEAVRHGQKQGRAGDGVAGRHPPPRRHEQILVSLARRQGCAGARLCGSQAHRSPDAGRDLGRRREVGFILIALATLVPRAGRQRFTHLRLCSRGRLRGQSRKVRMTGHAALGFVPCAWAKHNHRSPHFIPASRNATMPKTSSMVKKRF